MRVKKNKRREGDQHEDLQRKKGRNPRQNSLSAVYAAHLSSTQTSKKTSYIE